MGPGSNSGKTGRLYRPTPRRLLRTTHGLRGRSVYTVEQVFASLLGFGVTLRLTLVSANSHEVVIRQDLVGFKHDEVTFGFSVEEQAFVVIGFCSLSGSQIRDDRSGRAVNAAGSER